MKNNFIFLTVFILLGSIFLISEVSAIDIGVDNYYPTPAPAGDYFNVWLKVTNNDNTEADNVVVRLKQTYPFSVDPGDEEGIILSNIPEGGFSLAKLKVRVDSGALEGDNPITFQYKDCPSCVWKEKTVSVTVQETQTSFDTVLQEIGTEGVYIAIANIGKNSANAVTVRIPEQDNFKTGAISSSIVGNLASGDYTIVSFTITSKSDRSNMPVEGQTKAANQGMPTEVSNEEKNLTVQIDYTDTSGVRRTSLETIKIDPSSLSVSSLGTTDIASRNTTTKSNSVFSNIWFWGVMILLIFGIGREIYQRKKQKNKK